MVDISYSSSLSSRFSANLSNRRKELGLTQAYLAEQMKMEPESISRFERGVTLPSLAVLEKLAGLLNTTIASLLAEYPEEAYPECKRRRETVPLKRPNSSVTAVQKCTAPVASSSLPSRQMAGGGGCTAWRCINDYDVPATSMA